MRNFFIVVLLIFAGLPYASQQNVQVGSRVKVSGGTAGSGVEPRTGTSYRIPTSDCGKLVTVSNTSPVAVTVPSASSNPGCVLNIANFNTGTATLTSSSTINNSDSGGAIALLDGQDTTLFSDGTNWNAKRQRSYITTYAAATTTSNQVTNSATTETFPHSLSAPLPANLPVGTEIDFFINGGWLMTSGEDAWTINVEDSSGTYYCSSDALTTVYGNGGGGGGFWEDCRIIIQATGPTGSFRHLDFDSRWLGDNPNAWTNSNIATSAGPCYPGYNEQSTRTNGLTPTFNDTTQKALSAVATFSDSSSKITLTIFQMSMRIQLP
jgi:hypothetical protein